MAEKRIRAYDARAEKICPVTVVYDDAQKPLLTAEGKPLTEEDLAALDPWDRRLTELMTEDLFKAPLFDGERIWACRVRFKAELPAREAERDDA